MMTMKQKLSAVFVTLLLATIFCIFPHDEAHSQAGIGPISVFDISPQASRVVTAEGVGRTIRIWDLTGQLLNTIQGPEPTQYLGNIFEITDVEFNSSGTQFAISFGHTNLGGLVWVFDTNTGQKLLEIQAAPYVGAIDWSPDNTQIVGSTSYGRGPTQANFVNIWSATSGMELNELDLEGVSTADVAWNPNSDKLVFSDVSSVVIWDVTLWQKVFSLEGHSEVVTSVAWSPDGSKVASTDWNTVRIWDSTTGQALAVFQKTASRQGIPLVTWSPDGSKVASTDFSKIEVWDTATQQLVFSFDEGEYINGIVWRPDGEIMYASETLQTVTPNTCDFTIATSDVSGLKAAITSANGNGTPDTICLSSSTYTLTAVDNTDDGDNGLPVITSPITLYGNGATITRDAGAPAFRLFKVNAGGTLTLENLTVSGGWAAGYGGAAYVKGTLVARNVTFTGNHAEDDGGAIYSTGTLTLRGSRFEGNTSSTGRTVARRPAP